MSHKNQRKQFFLFIGLCLVFNFNVSCKKNNEIPISKDSITILYIGDERIFHQDYWGMDAAFWIFLPLVDYDSEPVLAESWSHTEDYKIWTVKLRKDIFWHDGVQMTAHDIKFSFELRDKIFGGYTRNLKCELIDDFTFSLILEQPITNLPVWEVYYPKHLLEGLDTNSYYDWDFWKNPVGNGPYKFVRSIPKTMVEVEANPNYFRSPPKIKRVRLKFSKQASLQELLSGNVDAITSVPRDFLFKIDRDKFNEYYGWGSWIETIFWNHNNLLFSDAKVRQALTLAIDRIELSEVLNYPDNVPITDVLYPNMQRETRNLPSPLPYDPDKAIQLLKECGWEDTNGDGILDKNGVDFKFTLIVEKKRLMSTYIQSNYRKIGIVMDIVNKERNIFKHQLSKNDFEAILSRFPNMNEELVRMRTFLGKNSYLGYHNSELDGIFDLIESTGDIKKIDSLYKKIATILKRDFPVTFLFPIPHTNIVTKNIKGLQSVHKSGLIYSMETLWIE